MNFCIGVCVGAMNWPPLVFLHAPPLSVGHNYQYMHNLGLSIPYKGKKGYNDQITLPMTRCMCFLHQLLLWI